MFEVGSAVWRAWYRMTEKRVPCPDCFGKLRLTVILGDESQVSIPCEGCTRGYGDPSGFITVYEYESIAEKHVITGVTLQPDKVEYQLSGQYTESGSSWIYGSPENVFETEEAALKRANELKQEQEAREQEQRQRKEYNHRSWAWHVTYYRRELKRCEEGIERYREKLGIAQSKKGLDQ